MMMVRVFLFCLTLLLLMSQARADFQGSTHMMPFDEDTIAYSKTEATGPVSRLVKSLGEGKTMLKFDSKYGYLPSVLKALQVPVESQVLVFSKTSLQRERISPQNPRALYFNDDIRRNSCPIVCRRCQLAV